MRASLKQIVAAVAVSFPLLAFAQTQPADASKPAEPGAAAPAAPAAEPMKPAEAPKPAPAPAATGPKFSWYGFVLLAGFSNDGTFGATYYPNPNSSNAATQNDYPGFANGGPKNMLFSARQSRLGVNVDLGKWEGFAIKANIETDFQGGYGTPTANSNQWYAPIPRLRIATGTIGYGFGEGGNLALSFGHDWGLVNNINATSSAWVANPIFWYAGNLYTRMDQVKLAYDWMGSVVGLNLAAAVVMPFDNYGYNPDFGPSNRSKSPGFQARLGVKAKVGDMFNADVGVGIHKSKETYAKQKVTCTDPAPVTVGTDTYDAPPSCQVQDDTTQTVNLDSSLTGIDAQIGITKYILVKGEWFKGTDVDGYNGNFGAGVRTFTTNVIATPAAGYAAGDGKLYQPITNFKALDSTGMWWQVVVKPFIESVQLTFGMGKEEPTKDQLATSRGQKVKNEQTAYGIIYTPTKAFRVGLEFDDTKTTWYDPAATEKQLEGKQVAFSFAVPF